MLSPIIAYRLETRVFVSCVGTKGERVVSPCREGDVSGWRPSTGFFQQPECDVRRPTGAPGSAGESGDARDPPYILNYHRENTNNHNKDNKFYCSQALTRDIVIGF